MSLHNLAQHVQRKGRGQDKMLVHMTPEEVHGLQRLAMAHGGSLTINPETGLPEAGFLSSILPTVLGAALTIGSGGAINPMMSAAIVGAGTGAMTGSLKKGLMAGLGAFSGAGMAPGITGASTLASTAPVVNNNLGAAFQTAGGVTSPVATAAAPAVATVPGQVATTGAANYGAGNIAAANNPAVTNALANPAVVGQNAAPSVLSGIGDKFAQAGSGLKNIFTNEGGAGLEFLKNNKMDLFTSAASALMNPEEKEKAKKEKEDAYVFNRWPSNYSRQEMSARPAGGSSERTYFAADGGMVPGPEEHGTVEHMSQMNQNAVGDNTRYPMASQTTPTYAMPAERPISQNVIYPSTDAAVGSYTGMAGGGIASLAAFAPGGSVGFKSNLPVVKDPGQFKEPAVNKNTAKLKTALTNAEKYKDIDFGDAQQRVKDLSTDLSKLKKKTPEYNSVNAELAKARADVTNAQKYKSALSAYDGVAAANQKAIDDAKAKYETAKNAYSDYKSKYDEEKKTWEEQTKRTTSGITARGQYAKGATGTESAADLQARIKYIQEHPEQSGPMGGNALSATQQTEISKLKDQLTSATNNKVYNPKTNQYETDTSKSFQELKAAPTYDTKKKIQEEDNVRQIFEEITGRSPTQDELKKYGFGKNFSDQDIVNAITNKKTGLAELNMAAKFSTDDLNDQAKYYWGRDMTKGELAYFQDPANKFTTFNALRGAMQNNPAYLQNLNKINQAAFSKEQSAAQIAAEGPASQEQISSLYQDVFGKPPTGEQLQAALSSGASKSQLMTQLKASPEYSKKMTQPLVPDIKQTAAGVPALNVANPMTQERMNALLAAYNATPTGGQQTAEQLGLAPLMKSTTGQGGYTFNQPQQQASIEGALPYQDNINRLGISGVYQQLADKAPALQAGMQFNVPQGYTPIGQTARPMADGGYAGGGYHLGDYSDGGRLLKGPGDGVSDSIPASIGNKQPARLADGEFVIPARIVSELGNGSTEAGARQLYAMMDRVQKKRRSTVGKDKVAVNSKANQVLPA